MPILGKRVREPSSSSEDLEDLLEENPATKSKVRGMETQRRQLRERHIHNKITKRIKMAE
jgi:hypothetical protein